AAAAGLGPAFAARPGSLVTRCDEFGTSRQRDEAREVRGAAAKYSRRPEERGAHLSPRRQRRAIIDGKERVVTQSLAPAFLLSMPQLVDPNFSRTVVLLCRHSTE